MLTSCARLLLIAVALVVLPRSTTTVGAQADQVVLARVIPAAVQIALIGTLTDGGLAVETYIPVASGTVISRDGLILTNAHAVAMNGHRAMLAEWELQAAARGEVFSFELQEAHFLILGTNGAGPTMPMFRAAVLASDVDSDLALLEVVADEIGTTLSPSNLDLPFIPLGDSSALQLAEPIDILGYPVAGGDSLTYTTGVVSGFLYEADGVTPAWINTDATISGGSSGGTAVNRRGELIGVPTQGSELDCRPGDTNRDGQITAEDLGCIPVGGSIAQLRPVNTVRDLVLRSGANQRLGAGRRGSLDLTLPPTPSINSESAVEPPASQAELFSDPLHAHINRFWAARFAEADRPYDAPNGLIAFSEPIITPCGRAEPEKEAAFYCVRNETIYYATDFRSLVETQIGDFAWATVVAHEWSHNIQDQLGFKLGIAAGREGDVPAIDLERQADCLAGAYASDAERTGWLEPGDIDEALYMTEISGDPPGTSSNDPSAKGTGGERVDNFLIGYQGGLAACNLDLSSTGTG